MSDKTCYYEVLGVERAAEASEIKRAYRKLAMANHPDRNPGDAAAEDRFKQASEAYQVLSDDEKRRVYDAYGHEGLSGQGFRSSNFEDIFSQFGDIFGDIFGGGGGRRRGPRPGTDLRYDIELTFEEAAFGLTKEIVFDRDEPCEPCGGDGAKPGTTPSVCGTCQGLGRVTRQQGFFMVQTTCPVCRGTGRVITDRCEPCEGAGTMQVERTVSVTIPPGVDTGMRLRVGGEGEGSPSGGPRGDLYVVIHAQQHPTFQRDGADVHAETPISLSDAALGVDLEVETIHGQETVSVPAGTQPDTIVRLRRKGIARVNGGGQGDHYVRLRVDVPMDLSARQRELLQSLREEGL
ncbi:MAG: molecular chaperone DnaJ [Deltaproteobacteria bacterium]|nr:molecular chaperone DnaJ [Deltaproteobacteria bacterium]